MMISLADVFHVISAIIPLYVVLIAAYLSIKWWKLFTPDHCAGINKFVANFSIPLLSFQVISSNNPFKMNMKLVSADFLQKLITFIILTVIAKIRSEGSMSWVITGLSLSTLPNTLILGIPLLRAMYGDQAAILLAQIVVLQSLIWYNLLLVLFEIDAAKDSRYVSSPQATGLSQWNYQNKLLTGIILSKVEYCELNNPRNSVILSIFVAILKSMKKIIEGEMEASQGTTPESGDPENGRIKNQRNKKIRIILSTVGKKLIRNPNTHATLAGITWASIHYRWGAKLPKIVENSVTLLSNGGLGMAMFSLGLFMASQASLIACGTRKAVLAMVLKFVAGPCLMAVPSTILGLRGTLFKVAIVQAALPQGLVPFVFAKEYNQHPDILSTGVIFGLLIAVPIGLAYYFMLAL